MTIGIYQIQNKINGKIYIGQSIDIEKRLKQHLRDLRKSQHYNSHFQNAFDKYGENAFKAYIITICLPDQLDFYEKWFICITGATNEKYGYNKEIGGNKPPIHYKENHHFWRKDIHKDDKKIIQMYKQGIRVKNISEQYNCCTSTIERILERGSTPRNYEYHIAQSIETKKKKSKAKNKIGFFRVYKRNDNRYKQGFRWIYEYKNKKQIKRITSTNLYNLKEKVISKNEIWEIINIENAKTTCKKYNYNIEKLK